MVAEQKPKPEEERSIEDVEAGLVKTCEACGCKIPGDDYKKRYGPTYHRVQELLHRIGVIVSAATDREFAKHGTDPERFAVILEFPSEKAAVSLINQMASLDALDLLASVKEGLKQVCDCENCTKRRENKE